MRHYSRDASGRFVVKIPFRDDPNKLGASRKMAERRLLNLERRFKKDPKIKQDYVDFLNEYEGHTYVRG